MLRITIELVPHGDESRKRVIAKGEIANVHMGMNGYSDYVYRFDEERMADKTHNVIGGKLERVPRGGESLDLLALILRCALGNRTSKL